VFATESVQVPVPFLVTVPVEAPITPETVPVPEPSSVNARVPLVIAATVSVPEVVAVIVDANPKVIVPTTEALPPVLVNAPAGDAVNPVPFSVRGSVAVPVNENPFKSNTEPRVTDVRPAVVPRGPAVATADDTPSFSVPALIVVRPVYVFAPESVHVPVPLLVTVPDVVPITPATLPLPEPPNVRANVAPDIVAVVARFISPALAIMLTPVLPSVIAPL
jgi:hypothetical protein